MLPKHIGQNCFYFIISDEAIQRFQTYQRFLPMILQADENLGTLAQVQLLCDACRQQSSNSQYTPLHLSVELDLKNVITNDEMSQFLNKPDSQGRGK